MENSDLWGRAWPHTAAHGRILTVVYTMPHEETIHLISARRATKREIDYYVQYRQ